MGGAVWAISTFRVTSVTACSVSLMPTARIDGLMTTESANELLMYDTQRHEIQHPNHTYAVIWYLCDGGLSVTVVVRHILLCFRNGAQGTMRAFAEERAYINTVDRHHMCLDFECNSISRDVLLQSLGNAKRSPQ